MADNKRQILEFVIKESYTPDTFPMARLAQYLEDLAILLGEKDRVHFVGLKEGSTAVLHAVDHEAIPKVHSRVLAVRSGDAEPEALHARERIERRLREDNGLAVLRPVDDERGRLLYFPGASQEVEDEYGPISEAGQLYGVPILVGGKKSQANVNIQDGDRTYYCEASRELALQIAPLLFNYRVRVHGTGRYVRDTEGQWLMKSFRIAQFERLDARSLGETVERLRGITRRVGLDKDIVLRLAELREG